MKQVAFIGHGQFLDKCLRSRLKEEIERQILIGKTNFIMGRRGDFDRLALSVCLELKQIFKKIQIEVVITSLSEVAPQNDHTVSPNEHSILQNEHKTWQNICADRQNDCAAQLNDCNFPDATKNTFHDFRTVMFNVEEVHYKRKIIESNKQMIDSCDTLICYVDPKRTYGGAILAFNYAKKKGVQIVNLYSFQD